MQVAATTLQQPLHCDLSQHDRQLDSQPRVADDVAVDDTGVADARAVTELNGRERCTAVLRESDGTAVSEGLAAAEIDAAERRAAR